MESNINSRIRRYIFIFMAAALAMIILITTVVISGLSRTRETEYRLDTMSGSNYALQHMQLSFGTIGLGIRNFAISTDASANEEMARQIEENIRAFQNFLDSYVRHMNESDISLGQERDRINAIAVLMENYHAVALQIIEMGLSNDIEAMKAIIMEQETVLSYEMTNRLQEISEFNHALSMDMAAQSQRSGDSTIVMLTVCAVIAFVFLIVISIITMAAIRRILESEPPYIQNKDNNGSYKDNNGNHDAHLLLSEFAGQISELKAVAYDLTRIAKERK